MLAPSHLEVWLGSAWRERHPTRTIAFQPEHERYARGYRLWNARRATWSEIREMSLDDIDLMCLMLDAIDSGKPSTDSATEVYV